MIKYRLDCNVFWCVKYALGCIECPYHGWQFDSIGLCTKIPQQEQQIQQDEGKDKFDDDRDNSPAPSKIFRSTNARTLRTHVTGDLVWAFVDLPPVSIAHCFFQ